MSSPPIPQRHRGQRRFWNTVEHRYLVYERPERIDAVCRHCRQPFVFHPTPIPHLQADPEGGGYRVLRGQIQGQISGQGVCSSCTREMHGIDWPEAARFQVALTGGLLWCWNAQQLPALRARIAGDRRALRAIEKSDWRLTRILGRVPKFALLLRHRPRLLSQIDRWIHELQRGD